MYAFIQDRATHVIACQWSHDPWTQEPHHRGRQPMDLELAPSFWMMLRVEAQKIG